MTKFNVGDKVICIKDYTHFTQGKVYKIQNIVGKIITLLDNDIEQNDWYVEDFNKYFEIVPTKNQRITALENEVADLRPLKQEVAELKLIVHELRGKKSVEPSTTNTVEDIIEFEGQQYRKVNREGSKGDIVIFRNNNTRFFTNGEPYKVAANGCPVDNEKEAVLPLYHDGFGRTPETVDVYELIKEGLNPQIPMVDETVEPLTPNQQRAEIIEKAKKFVKNVSYCQSSCVSNEIGNETYQEMCTDNEFIINDEKRTVVVSVRCVSTGQIYEKGIAKCAPDDVFNEHIGKAIALGRALGLDVSEFEQAVQPTLAIGQIVYETEDKAYRTIAESGVYSEESMLTSIDSHSAKKLSVIINDTDAIYEVIK